MEEPLPSTSRGSFCQLCRGGAEQELSITLSCSHTYHLHCVENRRLEDSECLFCHTDDRDITVKRTVAAFCDKDQRPRSGSSNDPQCGICRIRVPKDDVVILSCSHAYHLHCFGLLQLENYECLSCVRYDEDIAASENLQYLVFDEDSASRERLTHLAFSERSSRREGIDTVVVNEVSIRDVPLPREDGAGACFDNNEGQDPVRDEEIYFDVYDDENPEQILQEDIRRGGERQPNEETRLRNEVLQGEENDLEEEEEEEEEEEPNDLETVPNRGAHAVLVPEEPPSDDRENELAEADDSLIDGEVSEIDEDGELTENESVAEEDNAYLGEDEDDELSVSEEEDAFSGDEDNVEDDVQSEPGRAPARDRNEDSGEDEVLFSEVSDESDEEIQVVEEIVRRFFIHSDEESLPSEVEDAFEDDVIENRNRRRQILHFYEEEIPLNEDEMLQGIEVIDVGDGGEEEDAGNGVVAGRNVLPTTEQARGGNEVTDCQETPERNNVPECAICLDDLIPDNSQLLLRCSHAFHSQCISRWLQENPSCPVCRR